MPARRSSHTLTVVALLAIGAGLPLTSLAGGSITVAKQAPYAQSMSVPDAVRAECNLPNRVSEFVKEYADKSYDKVTLADNVSASTPGQALSMKIVGLTGTGGGAFGGYKGTCAILGRCVKAIGKDVGEWLLAPKMNAKLGDAK